MDERTNMDGSNYRLYVNTPTPYIYEFFSASSEEMALAEVARILAAGRAGWPGDVRRFSPDRYGWSLRKCVASNSGTGFELKLRSEW
jgi:hypothetical protein